MKRILFITPFAPSNIGAAMKFTKRTIEMLSQLYEVDLIYHKTEGEPFYLADNKIRILKVYDVSFKDRIMGILHNPLFYPIFMVRYHRNLVCFLKKIKAENQYDLIFLDHSQSFIYGRLFKDIPKILMSHDVIYQRVSRTSNKLISWWCKKSEKQMLQQPNSHIFSFSEKDRDIIMEQYGLDSYVTCGNIDEEAIKVYPQKISNDYIFFGQWVRKDNSTGLEWFLKEVYPKVADSINIKIIGRGLSFKLISLIDKLENVEYLGFVDNPYQLIANSKAVLSPLFSGAGVKFKVLESIACGTPVIGNDIAFEGISTDFSDFMINANSVNEYIGKMSLIDDNITNRIEMKKRFLDKYINPYLIKHIHLILG